MQKLLNITDEDRALMSITFDVNRFVVVKNNGAVMFAVYTTTELDRECHRNKIPMKLDSIAARKYKEKRSNGG